MKRALLIVNPTAGRFRPLEVAARTREHLAAAGWEHESVVTEYAGHAVEIARQLGPTHDVVVAVGGDGTLRETAIGLENTDIPTAMVPVGNANVVARDLGIPQRTDEALQVLTSGVERRIDVGQAGDTAFLAMVGIGYDGWVVSGVSRLRSGPRGRRFYSRGGSMVMYAAAGVPALLRVLPNRVEVTVDGRPCPHRYPTVVISNTETYALGWAMSPGADASDGRLDHHLNRRAAPWFVLWTLLSAIRHRRVSKRIAEYGSGTRYRIRAPRPFRWQVDGDAMPATDDLEVTIRPAAARVIVPRSNA